MAGFSTFIIFTSVLCQLPVTATSGPLKEVVGALGGSVTFTVSFPEKQIDTVIWIFNTFTVAIVNKDNAKVLQNPKKEKILFPDGSYSMKLSQLKKNDSGVYRAEIHSTSLQSPFTQEYVLYVYETLSAPKVTTDEQPSKNGSCTTKLTCSVEEEGDNVTYSWKAIGQGAHELHDGAILPISWKLGEKEKTLICMARNPISHSSSNPVLARNLCEDTANLDKSSPRFILYTLPVAIVFSLTLIIAFAVRTEKGKGSKKDTERVDNFCPLEENTEYATIPYINERSLEDDAANTLYSTVQIPKAVKSPSYLPAEPPMRRQLSFENII